MRTVDVGQRCPGTDETEVALVNTLARRHVDGRRLRGRRDRPAALVNPPGIPCMLMRGGTSKGAYFVADDLPLDPDHRDHLLMGIMGTPDARQIDGIGGAHPLTSKVAVVARSARPGIDVDYLFLQVGVEQPRVSDQQNCGNLLAGVGPFALERGLIELPASRQVYAVEARIHMVNTGTDATATFPIVDGMPDYEGRGTLVPPAVVEIDGVPGSAAAITLTFDDITGGSCGALLPTGRRVDVIDGVEATLIDNGMPVVVLRADQLGIAGDESPDELERNGELRRRLESIRLRAGHLMRLGDVTHASVPKLTMVSPPVAGGHLGTRTFIPHRCHEAIGVLGAVSVATAALLPDSPAASVARLGSDRSTVVCEHPSGTFETTIEAEVGPSGDIEVRRAGIVRTARKLMDGVVFPPS